MVKKKLSFGNPLLEMFKLVFVGVFGMVSAYAIIGLYSVVFVGLGYYIIKKYNKPDTKLKDDLQTGQYGGIVFVFLGMLPWIRYFFASFMVEGGKEAFGAFMDE
jgi:hypothetical protein|tara:strand:+ start:531 stop:842 length:312 start_codon:yes stop_codon:yes gene_type:complete